VSASKHCVKHLDVYDSGKTDEVLNNICGVTVGQPGVSDLLSLEWWWHWICKEK